MKAALVKLFAALLLGLVGAVAVLACGDGGTADKGAESAARLPAVTQPAPASANTAPDGPAPADGATPVMPNVDPAEAAAASEAAVLGFDRQRGGSGAEPVWGPNIVEGWAYMGMADAEGNDYQEMLLKKESGGWVVKDIGQSLILTWKDRSPAGLWP